jgi:hypothetical protein
MAVLATTNGATYPWWYGQPTIWLPGALALGLVSGGWAALILVKPSLLPFALVGINRRSWWWTVAGLALLSISFGTLWVDWFHAVTWSDGGLFYSLWQVPGMLIPIVAWLGRQDPITNAPSFRG